MNEVSENNRVPVELAGQRLDKAAAHLFPDYSRTELNRWIGEGALLVDGAQAKPKQKLAGGENLTLNALPRVAEQWHAAEEIPLEILHEDSQIIVVNKPAGLVVHPGAGNMSGTLVNALLHYRPELKTLPRAGVVHRLDKETSGVMVVAADAVARKKLSGMISAREVHRQYVCVAEGRMVAGRNVDQPIGRDPNVRTRQAVREDGKPAYTEFRVIERFAGHTLVDAILGSGRTHQIRVHMQSIGYPLVGDKRYGARGRVPGEASRALIDVIRGFQRQALHAHTLELLHPKTEEWLSFSAPWPADLQNLVDALRVHEAER